METMLNTLKETWNNLSKPMRIGGGLAVAGVFMSLVLLALLSSPNQQPLFTSLTPDDAAAIVGILRENGINYQITDNGTTILVPQEDVYETRMTLASQGLPRGGVVGFEIFNTTRLGETEADRQLRYLWALQGELTRTIRELSEVVDARVHIVIPRTSLFIRDSQPSTASVLLHLNRGVRLTNQQIQGMTHLIATSVEGLSPENVTIVDGNGNVLSQLSSQTDDLDGSAIAKRFELERAYEKQIETRVIAMLERIFGYGTIVALVNAQLDFDTQEEYQEIYEAPTRDGGLIRSQQLSSEAARGDVPGIQGVPGVETNVPGYVGDATRNGSEYERMDSLINYELNRIERQVITAPGSVKRLSVSVWINGDLETNQLSTIENSVIQAIGLRLERGDQIAVNSVPFETDFLSMAAQTYPASESNIPWMLIGLSLLGFIVILVLIKRRKPLAVQETAATSIDITLGDTEDDPTPRLTPEDKQRIKTKERLESLAKDHPNDVAQLIKAWMTEE